MLQRTLKVFFIRDLIRVEKEIELYKHEHSIWLTGSAITNSAGNLCLHLIGNLNTYVGAELSKTGYVRQRDLEFSLKNVPRSELLNKLEETIKVVDDCLENLTDASVNNEYPVLVFETKTSTGYMLMHLATHLNYHLGQINYHRRFFDQ